MERMALEFDGKVAVLKFNHPEVLNAIGAQIMLERLLVVKTPLGHVSTPGKNGRSRTCPKYNSKSSKPAVSRP